MSTSDRTPRAESPSSGPLGAGPEQESTGELVSRVTREISDLVRSEMRLAQLEMSQKAKNVGFGAGLFGAAGLVALYGVGALVATAILALALVLSAWLAALVVGVALLIVAGILGPVGKKRVSTATPVVPERTVDNLKRDVEAVRPTKSE